MVFELSRNALLTGSPPTPTPPWMDVREGRAVAIGEPVGFPEIYIYRSANRILAGTSSGAVLDAVRSTGGDLTISPFGISHLLHHGLIPPPITEWEDVFFLGIGDRAEFVATSTDIELTMERVYPYLERNSTGTSRASTRTLLDLLAKAVDRQLAHAGNRGFLMMSSGKDSVAVAVALAEGSHRDIPCVTYRTGPTNRENEIAADICDRLGLEHRTLDMPTDQSTVERLLIEFFEGSPRPCGDFALIPYALSVAESGLAAGTVLDGSGSDIYMGYVPQAGDRTKLRYRIRHDPSARVLERLLPLDSPLNYFTRSRVATTLPGRTFRRSESRRFYPDSMDTRAWWLNLSRATADLDWIDLETAVASLFTEQAAGNLKAHVAASAFGLTASFPHCDPDLASYFFNLPRAYRYDPKSGTNKILVRRMLAETIGYDADAIGKHHFDFDGDRFLVEHRDFVLSEIAECELWTSSVAQMAARWLDRLEHRPFLYHSLLVLFQISAWHNHSRYAR